MSNSFSKLLGTAIAITFVINADAMRNTINYQQQEKSVSNTIEIQDKLNKNVFNWLVNKDHISFQNIQTELRRAEEANAADKDFMEKFKRGEVKSVLSAKSYHEIRGIEVLKNVKVGDSIRLIYTEDPDDEGRNKTIEVTD